MTFTVDIHHHMLPDFFWRATNEGDHPVGGIAPPPWSRASAPQPSPDPCAHALGLPDSLIDFTADTTRAIAKLHDSNTFACTPDVKFVFVHAGGTVPYLAGRFGIVDEMRVIAGAQARATGPRRHGDEADPAAGCHSACSPECVRIRKWTWTVPRSSSCWPTSRRR